MKLILAPPFESGLSFKLIFGHEGSPTRKVEGAVSKEAIRNAFDRFIEMSDEDLEKSTGKFMEEFLGVLPASDDPGPEYYGFPD